MIPLQLLNGVNRPIILASGSPRRSQILTMMGVAFEVAGSGVADENAYMNPGDLEGSLCRLAEAKAMAASVRHPEALVLGADTVVVLERRVMGAYAALHGGVGAIEVLGKPASRSDAALMLRKLSGVCHTVITAVALRCAETGFRESAAAHTTVFFRELGDDEINHYLSFPEYEDKAGSYAVQGGGMTFIDKIEGCYYNVMGLPVTVTLGLFRSFIRKGVTNAGK